MKNQEQTNKYAFGLKLFPSITDEDNIDIRRCAVPKERATEEIIDVNKYLKLYDSEVHGFLPVETVIGPSKFNKLYAEAIKLYRNEPNYITALKVKIVADTDSIKLIYRPILLLRSSIIDTTSKIVEYQISREGEDFIYDISSKDFIPIPNTYGTYAANYKTHMRIMRNPEEEYTPYISGIETEFVIFSFQEILEMISDNPAARRLFIFNCIKQYSNDPIASIKNSLMLSPDINLTGEKFIGPFPKMYGNLAHLCPPNCNMLRYKLDVI
jgi:hypothetical protein